MKSITFTRTLARRVLPALLVMMFMQHVHAQDGMLVPLTDVSINKMPYIVAQEQGLFD